ncbi:hypothetical protein BDV97DRAFT_341313, partial [Delphinella strobiligena]
MVGKMTSVYSCTHAPIHTHALQAQAVPRYCGCDILSLVSMLRHERIYSQSRICFIHLNR